MLGFLSMFVTRNVNFVKHTKLNNNRDHRARTIDLYIAKHPQVRMRVHLIVMWPISWVDRLAELIASGYSENQSPHLDIVPDHELAGQSVQHR